MHKLGGNKYNSAYVMIYENRMLYPPATHKVSKIALVGTATVYLYLQRGPVTLLFNGHSRGNTQKGLKISCTRL